MRRDKQTIANDVLHSNHSCFASPTHVHNIHTNTSSILINKCTRFAPPQRQRQHFNNIDGSNSNQKNGTNTTICATLSYTNLGPINNVSKLALGTWSWGNRLLYSYEATDAYDAQLERTLISAATQGISLIDTADSYGTGMKLNGRSEKLIGDFCERHADLTKDVKIATKYASYPWRLTRQSIVDAAEQSCDRLKCVPHIGQIHWPVSKYNPFQERVLWNGIADAYEQGYCQSIGLSNYGPNTLKQVVNFLQNERNVPVANVQIQLSLLSRNALTPQSGVIDVAKQQLNVGVIGYSPLCLGLLTGNSPNSAARKALYNFIQPQRVVTALRSVAQSRNVSVAQVAIAWSLSKDVVVLVGARNENQINDSIAATKIQLSADEIELLEQAGSSCKSMVENAFQTK